MKKIISIMLLLTLVLGLFAGCGLGEATKAENPLDSAVAYLKNMYDKSTKNEVNKLTADKELLPAVTIDGVSYPVSWAIEITSGPAECIVMAEGASAGTQKIKVAVQPEEEVRFTLVGTISDANGNTATISIKFYSPAVQKVEVDEGQKVVIYMVSDAKYMTGIDYLYTSSSGSQKHELELTAEKAEALPLTLQTNDDGTVTFVTDNGMYLFCDATHVMFVSEQSDYTKFILEAAEGGQYIKCAVASYNDKPQYLEVYSGYMTCYGMSETSNLDLYIFELQDAEGANGTVGDVATVCEHDYVDGVCTKCGEADPNYVDPSTKAQLPEVSAPVAGTAYKFGVIQVTNGTTVYVTGEVDGRYLVTTTDKAAAADVYVEEADGGWMFYILVDGAKSYVYIYNNADGKRSVAYGEEGTVFNFNAECGNWYTTFDGKECYLGCYNNFETISVSDTSYIDASNAGITQFPAGFFYAESAQPAGQPEVGVAYKLFVNHETVGKGLYFTGTTANKDYYFSTSESIGDAVDVYLEAVDGGFLLYFMNGDVKTYIDIFMNGTYINLRMTDAPTAVYNWNSEFGTLVATLEDGATTAYIGAYGTYETLSASNTSYLGQSGSFWTVLVPVN